MKKIIVLFCLLLLLFLTGCDRNQDQLSHYSVSGVVIDQQSQPLADVLLSFNDQYFVKTDAAGQWSRSGLQGELQLEPFKDGYSFSPQSLSLSQYSQKEDLCFSASKIKKYYNVSGRVLDQKQQPIPGVDLDFGSQFAAVKTDSNGCWQKSTLEGPVTITPTLYDWQFSPANITVSAAETETSGAEIVFTACPAENYGYYSLAGEIIDDSGQGVAAVVIEIRNAASSQLLDTAITDADGKWELTRIWGRVNIRPDPSSKAEINAFIPQSHQKAGQSDNVDFKAEQFLE